MPAPNRPNLVPAAVARRRQGDRAAIDRLVAAGYTVIPPDDAGRADLDALRRAAEDVRAATSRVDLSASAARAKGAPWSAIGQALGIPDRPGQPAGVAAWRRLASYDPQAAWEPTPVRYPCSTCNRTIDDYGPAGAATRPHGPYDDDADERGHAPDCPRHAPPSAEGA